MKLGLLALMLSFVFVSCGGSGGGGEEAPQVGLSEPNPDGTEPVVRFADVNNTVFKTSCAGCHQSRGLSLSFEDFAGTKPFSPKIFNRVFVQRDMPPNRPLTQLQQQVLRSWLEAGSPE